jgi:hypothetical protein
VAVAADALTTTANLKTELGISGSSQDTRLDKLIDRATDWIEGKTGRKLKARHYKLDEAAFTPGVLSEDYLYFDGDAQVVNEKGLGEYILPQFPVQRSSVTDALAFELSYLSNRGSDGDTFTALVENEDYVVDYEKGIVRLLAGRFTSGVKNYRITCTAGFFVGAAQPYVPDALEELCILECKRRLYDKDGVTSERIGTWSRTFDAEKAKEAIDEKVALFTRYRL